MQHKYSKVKPISICIKTISGAAGEARAGGEDGRQRREVCPHEEEVRGCAQQARGRNR